MPITEGRFRMPDIIVKKPGTFRNLPLKQKLFYILLTFSILVFSSAFLIISILNNNHRNALYRSVSANLSFSSRIISEKLQNVEALSSLILASNAVQDALILLNNTDNLSLISSRHQYLQTLLSNYEQVYISSSIRGMLIASNSSPITTNLRLTLSQESTAVNQALADSDLKKGGICWTFDSRHDLALLAREIREIDNLKLSHLGNILIAVDFRKLIQDANNAAGGSDDSIYLVLDGDRIVYRPGSLTDIQAADIDLKTDNDHQILDWNGHSYFVVRSTIPRYNWTYLHMVPYDGIAVLQQTSTGLLLFLLFAAIFLSAFIAASLIDHILGDFDLLVSKMEYLSREDNTEISLPEPVYDYSGRTDEMGRLHLQFDKMANELKNQIQKNYLNQILNREAKLRALESQINPHFLYNTLETIHWRARALGDDAISIMTESLGSLLRATLSNKKSLVCLRDELQLVQSYMNIQKIRFEDRLLFTMTAPDTLFDALMPPLSIQPLLENAIHYGMEEMIDACQICVSIMRKEDNLLVRVTNEGSVFETDLLEKLSTSRITPRGHGIGLLNIHQRIRLLFGENYGLSLSNENGLAVAGILLPYVTNESELDADKLITL